MSASPQKKKDTSLNRAGSQATPMGAAELVTNEFAALIESMGQLRAAGQQVQNALTDLAAPVADQMPAPDLVGAFTTVSAIVNEVAAKLAAQGSSQAEFTANSALGNMHRGAQSLLAIASLARSTAAAAGIPLFDDFCDNLKEISDQLALSTSNMLTMMAKTHRQGVATASALSEVQSVVLTMIASGSFTDKGSAPITRIYEARGSLAQSAQSSAKNLGGAIGKLIQNAQFSDQFAQRSEHICTLLTAPDCNGLTLAQVNALAHDTGEIIRDINDQMSLLRQVIYESKRQLRSDGAISALINGVGARERELSNARNFARKIARAAQVARDNAESLLSLVNEAKAMFADVEGCALQISDAATNAKLLAARSGAEGQAMATLAVAVNEQAGICLQDLDQCRSALDDITARQDQILSRISEASSHLQETLKSCDKAHKEDLAGLQHIEMTIQIAHVNLAQLTREHSIALKAIQRMQQAPANLSQAFAALPDAPPPTPERAAEMREIYTMMNERLVHDQFIDPEGFLKAQEAAAERDAAAPPSDDDLDDILF